MAHDRNALVRYICRAIWNSSRHPQGGEGLTHHPDCKKKHFGCSWKRCQDLRAAELRKPENRKAPSGYDSCTSKHQTEVIVYKDFHAYPAYIFEYHCLPLTHFDPYRHQRSLPNFRVAAQKKDFVTDFEAVRQVCPPHGRSATPTNEADHPRSSHSCSQDEHETKSCFTHDTMKRN